MTIDKNLREKIHKLNNLLFVASGRLEMILQESTLTDSLKKEVEIVALQIEEMKRIVEQLRLGGKDAL